ncbi:MAG TPA: radical SAM protein [Candidatus Methanomethylicus sp.]|nr:radical SAM protein [Candidatus Methanomethylicus sp.]
MDDAELTSTFNEQIGILFKDALRIGAKDPAMGYFLLQTVRRQKRAAKLRTGWEEKGLHVPPFLIYSVTKSCNLNCKGCYARAQHRSDADEMGGDRIRALFAEARSLGISFILLAGGEPLMRKELIEIAAGFPEIIFPFFTNGLLIDGPMIRRLRKQKNMVPVVSIEGYEGETDGRRGEGVYDRALRTISALSSGGVFFGTSITLTNGNFDTVTGTDFISRLVSAGCKLFFFIDYIPVEPGTDSLVLREEQKAKENAIVKSLKASFPALFLAFPAGEAELGGCLAAGRGFVHISPEGRVEPCPFSPFSDASLGGSSLKEALSSEFLRKIRENHGMLDESKGGCALWENREWVSALLGHAAPPAAGQLRAAAPQEPAGRPREG